MTTAYPYAVVKIGDTMRLRVEGNDRNGRGNVTNQQTTHGSQLYTGDYNKEALVHWCQSHENAVATLNTLNRAFPENSYALMKTTEVWIIPQVPAQKATYDENGSLLPVVA